MDIQERLQNDLKAAMKAREKVRVDVIRMARAALQKAQLEAAKQQYDAAAQEIQAKFAHDSAARDAALAAISADPHTPLSASAQEQVIAKEVKMRQETMEIYRKAGRMEQVAEHEAEIQILAEYLPKQLSSEDLRPQVAAFINELGLQGPAAIGKVMPLLMEKFKGQADGRILSQLARELLTK